MLKPTPKERVLFVRRLTPVLLVLFGVFSLVLTNFISTTGVANAAAANTINFQARLQTAAGAIVPDGDYNVEFKLYDASSSTGSSQGSCTGDSHCLWTETRTSTNKAQVINGYLSVNLGSVTAFGSNINWDQQLWMTMNIGGTGTATWDGEMNPRLSLTSVPAAFSAQQLASTNASGRSSLTFQGSSSGDQNFVIQDQGAAGTYNVLTAPSGSDGYVKLQGATPGSSQTGSFNISGTGMAGTLLSGTLDSAAGVTLNIGTTNAASINIGQTGVTTYFGGSINTDTVQTANVDRVTSGTLAIGNVNATTINIAANDSVAHTINVGTGISTAQTVTVGSTYGGSSTSIQGGSGGIGLHASSSSGTIGAYIGSTRVIYTDTNGKTLFNPVTDSAGAFVVQNAAGNTSVLSVDTSTGYTTVQALHSVGAGVTIDQSLTFTGSGPTGTYVTPLGASVGSRISITNQDLSSYSQLLALGVTGGSSSTARGLTIADARTGAHQETITILSPDENQTMGLGWQGATNTTGNNGTPVLSTSVSTIGLQNSGGVGLTTTSASGNQTTALGTASSTNGVLQLNNSTNANSASIQAPSVSTSYITNLPTAIGTTGQCVSVASVTGATQTLDYSNCLTSTTGVQLQATTPGTQQTGNMNISGVGIFGTGVSTGTLNSSGDTLVKDTSATAFQIQNASGTTLFNVDTTTNGVLTVSQIQSNIANVLRVGPVSYSVSSLTGFPNSAYITLDKGNTASDASVVLRDQGAVRGEIGISGDNNLHFKTASGTAGSETFTDRLIIQSTGETYTTGKLGVGGAPSEQLHVQASNTSGRVLTKIENTNSSTGSKASGVQLVGGTTDNWTLGTDIGLNGGNNFAIQDNNYGYTPRFLIDGSGNIGIGTDSPSANISFGSGADKTININTNTSGNGNNFTIQAGSGGGTNSNGGNLVLQGGAATGTGTGGGVVVKSQTNGVAAFQVQNATGTSLLGVNTSNGTITLGDSTSGNYVTFTASGGLTAYGTSQHSKSIVYAPEYTNAVFDSASDSACSSASNGSLTSQYDSTNYRNYYNWTSTQASSQCYDIILDVTLPNDFSSWASSDPINLQALASNTSNAGYAIAIRNVTGAAWDGNYGSGYASPGTIGTSWSDVASSSFSGTYNAGDRLNIKIRMTAKSSANLQLGNLTLNYNSKW